MNSKPRLLYYNFLISDLGSYINGAGMKSKILFVLIFIVLGFILLRIPVNNLAGSGVKFTLFDLFAPIAGSFLGTGLGIASVLVISIVNILVHGASFSDRGTIIRLFPTLFAVVYFSLKHKRSRWILAVPLLAILSFNLNPVGRSVWYYSLFWLIPILFWKFRERFLLARSLGATFTAHAVGGAIWIWAFNLPAAVWVSLIPVVIVERTIFALGISASYILVNNVLAYLSSKKLLPSGVSFNQKYLIKRS